MGDLKEELIEIKKLLKESKETEKEKKFKMPWSGKVSPSRASKGYVTVFKVNENGFLDIKKERIEEQTIMVDGIPRLATPEYVLHWKKNPIIILPSWSVKPFSPEENQRKSLDEGTNTKGYPILLAKMKSEAVKKTGEFAWWIKWVVGIGLLAVIGYALMTGGGK